MQGIELQALAEDEGTFAGCCLGMATYPSTDQNPSRLSESAAWCTCQLADPCTEADPSACLTA
jgi:hypothetical protein